MRVFYVGINLDDLRLSSCVWNRHNHIHNRRWNCLEHCSWTRVFDDNVKVWVNTLGVCRNGSAQGIGVSCVVCVDGSSNLYVACKWRNSLKAHFGIGSCWTRLNKCKRNWLIASWSLRYCKRNCLWLCCNTDLDCLCWWNRWAESHGSNGTTTNYIETVSLL